MDIFMDTFIHLWPVIASIAVLVGLIKSRSF